MKPAKLFSVVLTLCLAAVAHSAFAQSCPPRAGYPPNWCVPRSKWQGPGVPPNNFQPSSPNAQQIPGAPMPMQAPGPMPMQPQIPGGQMAMQPGQMPMVPQMPVTPTNNWGYQIQCFIDQTNYCTFNYPSQVPSGTGCHCGDYPGVTP